MRRVVIGGGVDIETVCRNVNRAIVAFNWSDPKIFVYQKQLFWLDIHSANGSGPNLRILDINLLRGVCAEEFQCVKPSRNVAGTPDEDNVTPAVEAEAEPGAEAAEPEAEDEDDEEEPAGPQFSASKPIPTDVANMVLATPMYWQGIPHLHSIVNLPFFRADGTLVDTHGYDDVSHIYYFKPVGFDLPRSVPAVGDLTPAQWMIASAWAREWLVTELFGDFPFASDADRANTVAMLLSPFIMQIINCPLPLFVLTADNPGVGKSLMAETVGRILNGGSTAKAAWPKMEEEFEKKIFAIFNSPQTSSLVIWDNVPEGTAVDSPALAGLTTARDWEGRLLGKSEIRRFVNNRVWCVTGNSLGTGGDMARRSVYCALAAEGPHPEDRPPESFRHPKLRQWIDRNRGMLVLACLTLVRAWQADGEPLPPASVPRMGDYAPWVETVGGILEVAGIPDFLGNVRARREGSDTGVDEAGALFEVVAQRFGATPSVRTQEELSTQFTCTEVADMLRKLDSDQREGMVFPPTIDKHVGNIFAPNEKALPAAISKWFLRNESRWQGDNPSRRVVQVGDISKVKYFQLEERYGFTG